MYTFTPTTHTFCDQIRGEWKPFCMWASPGDRVVEGWSGGSLLAEVEGFLTCSYHLLPPPQTLLDVKNVAHQNKFGEDMPHSH